MWKPQEDPSTAWALRCSENKIRYIKIKIICIAKEQKLPFAREYEKLEGKMTAVVPFAVSKAALSQIYSQYPNSTLRLF